MSSSPKNPTPSTDSTELVIQQLELKRIIEKKILINRMSLRNLEHQRDYSNAVIMMHQRMKNIADNKIELVKKLNPLYEQQLSNYDPSVEVECHKICAEINMLDISQEELNRLTSECEKHSNPMIELGTRIEHLESTIPDFRKFKKWRNKEKQQTTHNLQPDSCAKEAMGFGLD